MLVILVDSIFVEVNMIFIEVNMIGNVAQGKRFRRDSDREQQR
jgi:hypothetical protein